MAKSKNPNKIDFGSDEHAALLGIAGERDPAIKAAKEEALGATPEPTPKNRKTPISRNHTQAGVEILDGWVRRK